MKARAYAATSAKTPLTPFEFDRREPRARDVAFEVLFSGICHSDLHQARGEWGNSTFPMVPGHEVVGRVTQVGGEVKKFKVGDLVGVGCMVDSCRECRECKEHEEQFCQKGCAFTYNSTEMDRKTPTYGGYSTHLVADEAFVLSIPRNLDLAAAAPLLCAGITTYSPLRQWDVKAGSKVGVVGLGGLGHMAVKLAAAMGAEVTMLSTSRAKEADASRLGAKHFALTTDRATFKQLAGSFDLLIDTVSASHDLNAYLTLLRPRGVLAVVGVPPDALPLHTMSLINGNKRLVGSNIGGIQETQEMLDFCGKHNVVSDVEILPMQKVNDAYERLLKNDVRYRFVLDLASLKS